MKLIHRAVFYLMLTILFSCSKEMLAPPEGYYFKGKINGEAVLFELDSLMTMPLNGRLGMDQQSFLQENRLGRIWNAGARGIDILLLFGSSPGVSEIEELVGQSISFNQENFPNVALKVYYKERISEVESTYRLDQTDSYFEILEIKKIPIPESTLPAQQLQAAFWVRGKCAFQTETYTIEEGEFAIMLGKFP